MKTAKTSFNKILKELIVALFFLSPGGSESTWREVTAFTAAFVSLLVATVAYTELAAGGSKLWVLALVIAAVLPTALLIKAFKYIFRFVTYKKS